MKRSAAILVVLGFFGLSCGNRQDSFRPKEDVRFLMDTVVRITVFDRGISEEAARSAMNQAFEAMETMEGRVSVHIDTSEVARIVRSAGKEPVPVSDDTRHVLETAIGVSDTTGGAFDVTIGVIKDMWNFGGDNPIVPDSAFVGSRLPLVDFRRIRFDHDRVFLEKPGMSIDLGGIAKGATVDRGVETLKRLGIRSAIVEAGGDLRIFGHHPERPQWRIGIRHPRNSEGALFGVIETNETCIATSGDYERCFFENGKRYHHILDPKTGFPARGCISVTITGPNAELADAYATAVFVLGPEKGMALIERLPSIEGLILFETLEGLEYKVSRGLRKAVHIQ